MKGDDGICFLAIMVQDSGTENCRTVGIGDCSINYNQ